MAVTNRLYISPVVGDGLSPQTAFRAQCADAGHPCSAIIPTVNGLPVFSWCLCAIESASHITLAADPDLFQLPDPEASAVVDLPAPVRNALLGKLNALGVAGSPATVADAINLLGKHLDPAFDRATLGVG